MQLRFASTFHTIKFSVKIESDFEALVDKSSLKMLENGHFGEFFKSQACGQIELRLINFNDTKIGGKCQN